jgi:hypothetical protein
MIEIPNLPLHRTKESEIQFASHLVFTSPACQLNQKVARTLLANAIRKLHAFFLQD